MYLILLTLLLASLIGIIFMIGRKMMLIQNGQVFPEETGVPFGTYMEEWKSSVQKTLRIVGFVILVVSIRIYVKLSKIARILYKEISTQAKGMYSGKTNDPVVKSNESRFLRKMGEYKRRVKRIKQKVKEEEGHL